MTYNYEFLKQAESLGNVFLSRQDLDSLSAQKNHLEPEYEQVWNDWQTRKDDDSREAFLSAITPDIDKTVSGIHGADPNYLRLQGKVLAMKAMDRYDPSKSSLRTYLSHQLMPLHRMVRKQMNILSVPDRWLTAQQEMEGKELELLDELGRMPTTVELSDRMHISVKQIEKIRKMKHARNTGAYFNLEEESSAHDPEVSGPGLPEVYRQQFVLSALQSDPKSVIIYEHDNSLNGREPLSVRELGGKLGISPGAISQRRAKIREIESNAQKKLYG